MRLKQLFGSGAFGVIALAVTILAAADPAAAHDPGPYYNGAKWPPAPVQTNEPFWLATGVPFLARVELAIVNGARQWNAVNEPVKFAHQGWSNQSIIQYPNCPGNTNSYVFQYDIGSALGVTYTCQTLGVVNSFVLAFDSNPSLPWYSDTGTPPLSSYDRWSVASHEFGHATGFYAHWPATSTRCQDNVNQLTMCPSTFNGRTWQRDLGDHDIHTFQAAY